tara:strand:+ start:1622 stop:2119 length:498 start_codon:yes stop_codon:yes gene_type:complete
MFQVAVLTISDGVAQGNRVDTSGQAIREIVESLNNFTVVKHHSVPDEKGEIITVLKDWADSETASLIFTTGGTGLGPRDVTPEATAEIIDRPVPGIPELMRSNSMKTTPMAMISRQIAGTRGRCLIINLPGSPHAVRECIAIIEPVLSHALEVLSKDHTQNHPNT